MYLQYGPDDISASTSWELGTSGNNNNEIIFDNGFIIEVYCKIPVRKFDFESRIKVID